ncbi:GIY-YIG nuclease family protein [Sphingomonas hankookensis]|uniref:GIY-YIG nuclease family protein n=1 Tax=Sphingomonas hankookensis TaxID=563996 RepID=UPI0030DD1E60
MVRIFEPCVYIVASRRNGTFPGFTADHNCARLVWFKRHETMETAIQREKRIKKWNRDWKQNLVERTNPTGTTCPRG